MPVVLSSSGGGSITLDAPSTAASRTLTLPDATGTVALTSDPSMVLLGTITTTSGSSQSLNSLTLTPYKQLVLVYNNVQSGISIHSVASAAVTGSISNSNGIYGQIHIDLTSGAGIAFLNNSGGAAPSSVTVSGYLIRTSLSTASTSVTVSTNGTYTAGSVLVYGVK